MLVFLEFRFHGRGGQGVVVASYLLVKSAFKAGFWGQSIPMFGAERRGAPVEAYTRISDSYIKRHSQVYNPDIIIVFDSKLMEIVDVTRGLKDNGIIVLNSNIKLTPRDLSRFKVYFVDATDIAVKLGLYFAGFPIVNTAMIGALAKVINIIPLDSVLDSILSTWSGKIGELNAKAAKLAYDSTVGGNFDG
ncbi:MAG: 2-oxoacid:acceptor oxidoreductase family protein [Candidatus Methanomethylicia archaeon]|nr:2-oxoacid:acceptor oxidoreductase family protein [Candidatus Methanomethylicia archaeon]